MNGKLKDYKYLYCLYCDIKTISQNWKEHCNTRKHITNQNIYDLYTSDILTDNEEMDNKKRKCEEFLEASKFLKEVKQQQSDPAIIK